VGRLLPVHRHVSANRTFVIVAETHDPISMRSQVQYRVGSFSRDQTRPFAYNKRIRQKPYPFLLSYLEDSGPDPGLEVDALGGPVDGVKFLEGMGLHPHFGLFLRNRPLGAGVYDSRQVIASLAKLAAISAYHCA